jgi:hypothetical protein
MHVYIILPAPLKGNFGVVCINMTCLAAARLHDLAGALVLRPPLIDQN